MNQKPAVNKAASTIDIPWEKSISLDFLHSRPRQFTFYFIIFALILILIVNFFVFTTKISKDIEKYDKENSLSKALNIKDTLEVNFNAKLAALTTTGRLISILNKDENQKLLLLLQNVRESNGYLSVWVTTKEGTSYFDDGSKSNIKISDSLKKAMNGTATISQKTIHPTNEKECIILSAPIQSSNAVSGVISAAISVTDFSSYIMSLNSNTASSSFIVQKSGKLVTSSLSILNASENLFSFLKQNNIDTMNIRNDFQLGKSNVQRFTLKNKVSSFYTYAPLEHINDWFLVTRTLADTTLINTKSIQNNTIVFYSIIILAILIAFLYVYYIKRSTKKKFDLLAYTDQLTGYRNWSKFLLDVQEILKKNKDKNYTYIYANIENFKYINDIMGYDIGNKLLQHVSKTLDNNLNTDEPHTRVNADRFSFLMEYTSNDITINRLKKINHEINDLQSYYKINFLNCIIFGIYKIKDKNLPISTMGDRALLAMQSIHNSKDLFYSFYNSKIREKALLQKELEREMNIAIEEKQFIIYLQPKFNLDTKKVIGAEALIRWSHPQKGLIAPNKFIGLFEANGSITKLDYYVFERTCKLIRKWLDNGVTPIPISVNMSRLHIYNPRFAEELHTIVERYKIPINLLEIELTETINLENVSTLLNAVDSLKQYSFVLSIDDFGTGYSSLNLLKNLPVDILKIDREFFSRASDEKRGREIIASIIDMAKRLEMKTVAEGVELKEQADFLTSVNCDYVQGFLFSEPIPVSDFEANFM